MHTPTTLSRRLLETLGQQLATFTQKNSVQTPFLASIDLDSLQHPSSNYKNIFHDHIPNLSKKVWRKTSLGSYSNVASHLLPKSSFDKITDFTFAQIGKIAQRWAEFDLSHDPRFKTNLDASERHALARQISHQNRALAVLGGLCNTAGLAGILIDTLWLLTICLRNIFQIAAIYDRPLTAQQGISIAYEILAKVDLNKLQEKQTLLAGLGMLEAMANQNLQQYKSIMIANDESSAAISTLHQIEALATQLNLNLEKINLKFLHKIIPVTAVSLGATYNNMIINQVLDISRTVFAPTPKLTAQPLH